MNKYLIYFLTYCLTVYSFYLPVNAQIPIGAWRDHLPYNKAKKLAGIGNKIFCATEDGSLYSYDKKDNSIQKFSKVNGLSDADVSTIGSSESQNTLIIGYSNGNLDLVRNDSIINVPDIKRKFLAGDKTIYNILFLGQYAYLACGFGIVAYDLNKREIKDTYFFGEGGSQIKVYDITCDGQYLFAATENGIYKADLNGPNLVDYNSWNRMLNVPVSDAEYRNLGFVNNKLFSVYHNTITGFDEIITIGSDNWEVWTHSFPDQFSYLGVQNGYLVICSLLSTKVYDQQEQFVRENVTYYAKHALYDKDRTLWYADPESGLVRLNEAGNGFVIVPDGPAYLGIGDIKILSGKLWAGGGTEASRWAGYGAYSFINEQWSDYNEKTEPGLTGFLNISKIAIDPGDSEHVIGGSYGYGLAEFKSGILIDIIDEEDGYLQPVPGYGHGYVLVKGVDFEANGTLWVSLTFADEPVYRRSPDGIWSVTELNYTGFGVDTRINGILAASGGLKWLLIERNGLLVFEEEQGNVIKERFFTVQNQAGNLLDRVFCIAEDKEQNIWVGTNKGPVIFMNGLNLFSGENITGYQPEIPRNDGTTFIDFLLSTEKINCIAVNGANQKWLATEKSGAFLVSEDGKTEIHYFNEENSPLFSNNVQTIAVNDRSGEVFFGTDRGIISFRGRATEGTEDFTNVYAFPNPVRENYTGDIIITGLIQDVYVKITDISGNLVFETRALGGQAVWDGNNFSGQRVSTGVYLIFCTTEDGSMTHVAKLLFIR
ncbi:MAG: hypothetical protein JXB19_10250 [Bacteroidales bacterium]|nr:hypothetical protein [Bacteroidales bacterium]